MSTWFIERLRKPGAADIEGLAHVLIDCVASGASVSFMQPLSMARALTFWQQIARETAADRRVLLVARDGQGVCGTVQLVLEQPENQPHRADLSKLLVHGRMRRRGLGAALLQAAELTARDCGKSLLVLDTIAGSEAARLYERAGWIHVGVIPDYALMPHGGLAATAVYYRRVP